MGVDANGDNIIAGKPIDGSNVDLSSLDLTAGTNGAGGVQLAANGPTAGLNGGSADKPTGYYLSGDFLADTASEFAAQDDEINFQLSQIRAQDASELADLTAQNRQGLFADAIFGRPASGVDNTTLGSALRDTGRAVVNAGIDIVEGVPNLLSGALPGFPDYVPFLQGARLAYDTPVFGAVVEALSGFGAFKAVGAIGAAQVAEGSAAAEAGSNFVGPLIGKSGFRTSSELAEAVGARYQSFVDDAYVAAQRLEAKGLLFGNPNTRIGSYVDRISARDLNAYLSSEGILEGPNGLVQINRFLRDPAGSGLYVRPDVRIPAAGRIYDATVGFKPYNSTQIIRFGQYSGGNYITVIRPTPVGGSYSILP